MRAYYDLHIHTALSPCGDDDMTPFNIANMAKLNGLDIIAVTDHNTAGNARAVAIEGEKIGLTVIAGMELETSEEVHVVMLFPSVTAAEECSREVDKRRLKIRNRPDIYGRQIYYGENDVPLGEEENLLVVATDIGVYDTVDLAKSFGGTAFPAHIDRPSHGILQMLGDLDETMRFSAVEITAAAPADLAAKMTRRGYRTLFDSDAHYLHLINERNANFLELDELTPKRVIELLGQR